MHGVVMSESPESLYFLALEKLSNQSSVKIELRYLTDNALFDFFYKFFLQNRLWQVTSKFSDFDVFVRLLKLKSKRPEFLKCFQGFLDLTYDGVDILDNIIKSYVEKYSESDELLKAIDVGLKIGSFFSESARFKEAFDVFNAVESLCLKLDKNVKSLRKLLHCYFLRIYVEVSFCLFVEAEKTFQLANETIEELKKFNSVPNLAPLYANFSFYFGMKSEYDKAYEWSKKAMELLNEELPTRAIVNILRLSSRALIFKRYFCQAAYLIKQAVVIAKELYKSDYHPCFSNVLMDYGMFLLNYDDIAEGVQVYRRALYIRKEVFGSKNNMFVATSYEDLAYALYIREYSTGDFSEAREFAEKAIAIMERILPNDHLMLASTKRVKALILEEVALDTRDVLLQKSYLKMSEELHQSALTLSWAAFGEYNVQTAKHYGNLGRLYQSMKFYEKAEQVHLKAIKIKEELLGMDDYEVGLSIGHLASLYTFHMGRYQDAEELYLRSIRIALKLYGGAYSGLEYDYRGLIHVYTQLNNINERLHYLQIMTDWSNQRESLKSFQKAQNTLTSLPLETVKEKFFSHKLVVE